MPDATKRLVSIPEARERLGGIGHSTLYELVKNGELTKVNLGRRGLITAASIESYIERLERDSASEQEAASACVTRD